MVYRAGTICVPMFGVAMPLFRMGVVAFGLLAAVSTMSLSAQSRFLVSQYMYNGLVLNPAYAGSQQQLSLAFLYRRQWLNVKGAPSYQMLTGHTPLVNNTLGVGLLVSHETVGVHREYSAYAMFAYKFKLNFGYLSLGISGGVSVLNSRYVGLDLINADDPYLSATANNTAPNFGVGAYFYNGWMYAGLSVPYVLNRARIKSAEARERSVLRDVRSYYFTTGFLIFREGSFIRINPSTLVRLREGTPLAADFNLNLIFKERLLVGASYRLGEGFVVLSQIILNDNFRIMYSYDFTTSRLGNRAAGTHEIMINYRIIIPGLIRDPHCSAYF